MLSRSVLAMGVAAALIALPACSPVPQVLDTPKDGEIVALSVSQPMQVRWANQSPALGSWVLEKGAETAAVTMLGRKTEQPAGAAMALDVFDFVGAQKGNARLTFVYKRKDGAPPTPEEQVTISVGVT